MKIGLVTWIGTGNYGTVLQSFALHEKLKSMGYSVYIICGFRQAGLIGTLAKATLRACGLLGLRMKAAFRAVSPHNVGKFYRFVKENYNIATPISAGELANVVAATDVFVAGSDQIWNTRYRFDTFMFLDFADGKKKISYASSIGVTDIPQEHKKKVKELLAGFSHIGVRERTAAESISRLTGRKDVEQVLDPTFLLTPDDWLKVCGKARHETTLPDNYILCYLIGNNGRYKRQIDEIRSESGIKNVVVIPAGENQNFSMPGATICNQTGPAEFVDLVRRATLVCTDSFHATALSINMSKDFVELLRFDDSDGDSQNSRLYDLLDRYNLSKRLLHDGGRIPDAHIDYETVQAMLETDRAHSLKFLTDSIER